MSFENFPYTDFHALNLDWVIKIVKECKEITGATAIGLEELKKFVLEYFTDLNIQKEVNAKLDTMAADGTLEKIINQDLFNQLDTEIAQTAANTAINTTDIQKINSSNTVVNVTWIQLKYHGQAAIFSFTTNNKTKYMLFDGGVNTDPTYPFYNTLYGTTYNDAQTVYLKAVAMGISHFDYAVISHFHEDHVGGFGYCLKRGLIDSESLVICNNYLDWTKFEYIDSDCQIAKDNETEFKSLVSGYNLNVKQPALASEITFDNIKMVFSNTGEQFPYYYNLYATAQNWPYNNFSLFIQIYSGKHSILLPGDGHAIAQMLNIQYIGECDLLQIPHHGNDIDGSESFFLKSNPTYNIFNMGSEAIAPAYFPHSYMAYMCKKYKKSMCVTGFDGNFTFSYSAYYFKGEKNIFHEYNLNPQFSYRFPASVSVPANDVGIKYTPESEACDIGSYFHKDGYYIVADRNFDALVKMQLRFRQTTPDINNIVWADIYNISGGVTEHIYGVTLPGSSTSDIGISMEIFYPFSEGDKMYVEFSCPTGGTLLSNVKPAEGQLKIKLL